MDPITHAASGALAALACPDRPRSAWAVPLASLAAASPDIDVFAAHTPLEFLLLHRGISHSLFALPIMGLLLAICMYPWWRKSTPGAWSFGKTFVLAMILVLLHIWLDCVTTYGTMIFLPFSEYRVRLNGIFIVDFLLILPMLAGIWYGRTRRTAAVLACVWMLLYPAACVGLRMHHEATVATRLRAQGAEASGVTVLPDAFAPFFWRAVYQTNAPYAPPPDAALSEGFAPAAASATVWQEGLSAGGMPRTPPEAYPAAAPALVRSLAAVSRDAAAFFDFTLMPLQEKRAAPHSGPSAQERSESPEASHALAGRDTQEYRFYDLRFGSMLEPVRQIMALRRHGDIPFQLMAQRQGEEWTALRMVFSGADRETPWHAPRKRQPPTWWQWLVGLHG